MGIIMSYLKGIYYALLGRVDVDSYDCVPQREQIDMDAFTTRVEQEYGDVLELLAE